MLKHIGLAIAALGLTATAVPASAGPDVSIEFRLGERDLYRDYYKPYYGNQYNRYYPHCYRNEILVQDRRGRVYCVDRREYRRYYEHRRHYDNGRHNGWYRGY